MEHIHLGWALAGWLTRLPGLRFVIQAVVDASGGGPRLVRRKGAVDACDLAGPPPRIGGQAGV